MKHCPQCGAEYDEYVQFCFVDGVALVEGPGTKPPFASTPLPAPQAASVASPPSLPPPAGVRPALAATKPRSGGDGRGVSLWAVGLLLVPMILLFGVGGLVVALLFVNTGSGGETAALPSQTRAEVPPAPPAPPTPVPSAAPSVAARVTFQSTPPGAELWEGEVQLCATTPCSIEHPDYAPADRKFTLKLKDHLEAEHVLLDPSQVQVVTLKERAKPQRPRSKSGDDLIGER